MTTMSQSELDRAVAAHEAFINRRNGGQRLILRFATLEA